MHAGQVILSKDFGLDATKYYLHMCSRSSSMFKYIYVIYQKLLFESLSLNQRLLFQHGTKTISLYVGIKCFTAHIQRTYLPIYTSAGAMNIFTYVRIGIIQKFTYIYVPTPTYSIYNIYMYTLRICIYIVKICSYFNKVKYQRENRTYYQCI